MDRQNPKSVESLQGSVLPLQKVGLKASAEMPLAELEHVGTACVPKVPDASLFIIILYVSYCFIS
jgi:hypothetical protein